MFVSCCVLLTLNALWAQLNYKYDINKIKRFTLSCSENLKNTKIKLPEIFLLGHIF